MLDVVDIRNRIPHRYPFLLVDRIIELDPGTRAVGIKNVTVNEPFFQGHYPERPIMPGVLITEAMAQVGGLIFSDVEGVPPGAVPLLAGVDGMRFKRVVVPGDQLRIEATVQWFRKGVARVSATATVDDEVAAAGELMFAMRSADEIKAK